MTVTESRLKSIFLQQRQGLPLEVQIKMSLRRIREGYEQNEGKVYVAFSGGADSTVLLHLVRQIYPDVPAVFADTGLEFPEIREFVRTVDNVIWLKPKKTFKQITQEYGFPVVSKETAQKFHEASTTKSDFLRQLRTTGVEGRKRQAIPAKWQFLLDAPFKISHKCCYWLKHEPFNRFERETGFTPYVGTMADESSARKQSVETHGCFVGGAHPKLRPLSFWTSAGTHSLLRFMPHCKLYDHPYNFARTGCMACCFGVHMNSPNKFQIMKQTHPRIWEKALPALGINTVMAYMGLPIE